MIRIWQKGYICIPQAFPREAALKMQDFMWSELKRLHGFERDNKFCYWAFPEEYTHIAMQPIRRVDIIWEAQEIEIYDDLSQKAQAD